MVFALCPSLSLDLAHVSREYLLPEWADESFGLSVHLSLSGLSVHLSLSPSGSQIKGKI